MGDMMDASKGYPRKVTAPFVRVSLACEDLIASCKAASTSQEVAHKVWPVASLAGDAFRQMCPQGIGGMHSGANWWLSGRVSKT